MDQTLDTNEFELPETLFIQDIDDSVFQGIALQRLSEIEGISLIEGNFLDHLLGRESQEGVIGIHTEQDSQHQCISVQIELNIEYGVSIPKKAEEIQTKLSHTITSLTGLHVSEVHVVFRNIQSKQHLDSIDPTTEMDQSQTPSQP